MALSHKIVYTLNVDEDYYSHTYDDTHIHSFAHIHTRTHTHTHTHISIYSRKDNKPSIQPSRRPANPSIDLSIHSTRQTDNQKSIVQFSHD